MLFDKLLWRPRPPFRLAPPPDKIGRDGEQPLGFGEIVAASAYAAFGMLPLEFWPGYRNARKADDQDGG